MYGDGELMNWLNGSVQETSAGMVSKYFIKSKIVNSNIKTILGNIQADINN